MKPEQAAKVARYQAMPPEQLAKLADIEEKTIRLCQSELSAMRKAQRIHKTIANGGKVPQHTRCA